MVSGGGDGAGVGQMERTCSVGGADGFGSLNCLIRHDVTEGIQVNWE